MADHQIVENVRPILEADVPFFLDNANIEEQLFERGLFAREGALRFRDVSHLSVNCFDSVGRVDRTPEALGICEKRAQVRPVVPPCGHGLGIALPPGAFEMFERQQGVLFGQCLADRREIRLKRTAVVPDHVLEASTDRVNNTFLHLGMREHALARFREAGQAIDAGDEDVADTAVLQVGQHPLPKPRAFRIAGPQTQAVLFALQRHAEDRIHRRVLYPAVTPYFQMNGVEEHEHVLRIKRSVLPFLHAGQHTIGDLRNHRRRNRWIVQLRELLADVAGRHAHRVEGQHLIFPACEDAAMRRDDLGGETTVAVTRDLQRERTTVVLDGFLRIPVAAVATLMSFDRMRRVTDMCITFRLEESVENVPGKLGEQPLLPHQFIDGFHVLDLLLELFKLGIGEFHSGTPFIDCGSQLLAVAQACAPGWLARRQRSSKLRAFARRRAATPATRLIGSLAVRSKYPFTQKAAHFHILHDLQT